MSVRPLPDLLNVQRPALAALLAGVSAAGQRATLLPVDARVGEGVLFRLQVTAASALGAMAAHTGGMLIDHRWLRVLGGGAAGLPSLAEANGLDEPTAASTQPPLLEVARDVVGGRFAVNGGAFEGNLGDVFYFAPDTLVWESLGVGHGDFVAWALSDAVADFYADLRWQGWEADVAAVPLDQALTCYPPLFSAESRTGSVHRASVPWAEVVAFNDHMAAQLSALPDGATFRISQTD